MIKEFKEFAMHGNVLDLAIGVIIGGAFGKIVSSFVNDLLMPPLGLLIGGVNFGDYKIVLKQAEGQNPAVAISYGQFFNTAIDFFIIAFAVFILIKVVNKLKRQKEETAKPPEIAKEVQLLTEIRDLLKK
ncbi:MAG: large-conductance mechanosensitive channel protein MscL [Ignavibacteriales bacterium]|nr:large-conductance mechanosensitive channel protein MscL [Ignavibacteriales bacterium]